jgi:hypothetical protein
MSIVGRSSSTGRREASLRTTSITTLLLAVLSALVLQGVGLPHTHSGAEVGLYNQEHDLTFYAASGTVGAPPVIALPVVRVVISALVLPVPVTPAGLLTRDAGSRAPPAL